MGAERQAFRIADDARQTLTMTLSRQQILARGRT